MNAKDAIRGTLAMGQQVLTTYLSDLADADLLVRPAAAANHLAWQLGHLISSEHMMGSAVCADAYPALPAGFGDAHGHDAARCDDASKFCTKAQYLALHAQMRDATYKALEGLAETELDTPGPERMRSYCPTIGSLFNLIGQHDLMHCGQFATVRRILGKPVLI